MLSSKLDDGLDGPWCTLLKGSTVYALVEVDSVLAGDNVGESAALAGLFLLFGGGHLCRWAAGVVVEGSV